MRRAFSFSSITRRVPRDGHQPPNRTVVPAPVQPPSGAPRPIALLALGLIALGLHSFGGARWIRMRPPVLIRLT
jgi:hypothetical protein